MVQLLSLFITTIFTLSLTTGRPLPDIGKGINIQDLISDKVLPIVSILPKLTEPPKTINDVLKPLFPSFGDLAAPRVPTLGQDPKAHAPLDNYSVSKLKKLSQNDARKLRDDLIHKQLKKNASFVDNLTFFYMLDEALYNVGISLDTDVNFIELKIHELSNTGIKELDLLGDDTGKILLDDDKGKGKDLDMKKEEEKKKKEEKKNLTIQFLRRYLIFSKLTYLKRYIDRELKNLVNIF